MLVLVTDIFGQTSWCQSLIQAWRAHGIDARCVSPYDSLTDVSLLVNEQQAYEQFQLTGGMDKYTDKLEGVLQQISLETSQPLTCIGFSAGASALWQVASKSDTSIELTHCIGFYPGQIRHSLELSPLCPFTLVFPVAEEHFDVEAVIQHLVTKQNVGIVQVELKHGYANPLSAHFEPVASGELAELLINTVNLTSHGSVSHQKQLILALTQQTYLYKERLCL